MGSQYYYLVASLPSLDLYQKESMPVRDFLAACREQLSFKDINIVLEAKLDLEPENISGGFLREWAMFNRHLKNEIARVRAKKFAKKEADVLKEFFTIDPFCIEAVHRAVQAAHPLEAERILDEARWKKLEELSLGHYFDLEAVIIYVLKLYILDRQQVFRSAQGQEKFVTYQEEEIFAKMSL